MFFLRSFTIVCLLCTPGIGLLAQPPVAADRDPASEEVEPSVTTNPLTNPEGIVDRLLFFRTAEDWEAGELSRVSVSGGATAALVLDDERTRFPRRGRWNSPEVVTDMPFTEFVPSYNAETPGNSGLTLHVRSRDMESGEWSPWLYIGQWGNTQHYPSRTTRFEHGRVRVDNLILERPADAFQLRVDLYSYSMGEHVEIPSLRLLSASYSGVVEDEERRAALASERPIVEGEWARSLPVPFIPQRDSGPEIGGSTCSPTSTTMVMAYRGVEIPLVENCLAIYDREYGIFGNWARAVGQASEYGLDGYLTRVRSWEDVKAYIAEGTPLIASIRFRDGEFPSNVMDSTNGHLIVIRGMTPEGDIIVNDSASRDRGEEVVYKPDELAAAWFDKGGITYVIGGELPEWVPTYKSHSEAMTAQ